MELRQTVPSSEDPGVRGHTEDYLAQRGQVTLPQFQQEFDAHRRRLQRYVPLEPGKRLLEVGAGTGWFLILCARLGLEVAGVELNPMIAEHARAFGREQGHELDITVGNISDVELPKDAFDLVIAISVFEHVQTYGAAMANIHRALRPGGVFYMSSTNKFAPKSGEFEFPLYGWMPFEMRRRLRIVRQSPSVVRSSGIDFNQFTYWGLKRDLESHGFRPVLDQFEFLETDMFGLPTPTKKAALAVAKRSAPVRTLGRVFAPGTCMMAFK